MLPVRAGVVVLTLIVAGCQCPGTKETEKKAEAPISREKDEPSQVIGLGAGFSLAPQATYSASQNADQVNIKATGENPTAGYEVKLVQSMLRIWPPQWMLARKRPDGVVAQVITPFEVSASFKSDEPVQAIIVSDAAGRHEVKVEQAGK